MFARFTNGSEEPLSVRKKTRHKTGVWSRFLNVVIQQSMDRAQAAIAYLIQECNIPVRHVIAPGAMGTADPTASNESAEGRAKNRHVRVVLERC